MSRAITLIRVTLILLIVQSTTCQWKRSNSKKESVCKTKECKMRGDFYKGNMKPDIDPCQDFYTYTCGNFRTSQPSPKYATEWKVTDLLTSKFFSAIRDILEKLTFPVEKNKSFHQAKMVYDTCVKIPQYPKKKASDIQHEITKIREVSKGSLWDIHNRYLKLTGNSAFFRTKVIPNRPSLAIPLLMLMEPVSAFGSVTHAPAWKLEEKENYAKFLFHIIKSLKLKNWGSDPAIREKIHKVFEFRRNLDLTCKQNLKLAPDKFYPFTPKNLDMWFLDTFANITETQNIHWSQDVDTLLQSLPWQIRQHATIVAIRQKKYFVDLMELLKNESEEVLINHMEIYFAERHLKLDEQMFKLLEGTLIKPYSFHGNYIRENFFPRWETCIMNLRMPETLEVLVYNHWFPKDYPDIIDHIIDNLKIAIENQMLNSEWLNENTRKNIILKYNNLNEWIGFPPWVVQPSLHREQRDYLNDILLPNAWIDTLKNFLYIHAPLLMSPLFSPSVPALYNFGGIGATLARELYHAVAACGHLNGNVWKEENMRAMCMKKKLLFIEEFNNITIREFKNHYDVNVEPDTSISFTEDFADVMGLQAAYNVYKESAGNKSVCETLPHFEKNNCDQMFYIAFANSYCGNYTKKAAEERLGKATHSINSIRVNGAVAQMESFSTAFNCRFGTPMNPQKKLNMWEQ